MLPNWLYDSYKRYKKDTDSIANWLAQTARQRGYQRPGLNAEAASKPKAPRLKGKARGKAREAAASAMLEKQRIISLNDFTLLSEYIAGITKNPVRVPEALINTITRVIELRRRSGDYFKDHDDGGGHAYFVSVLEKVLDILRPLCPPAAQRTISNREVVDKGSRHQIENAFAALSVEEPSEEFLNAPDVAPLAAEDQPNYEYQAEAMDSEMVFFAIQCLLIDVNKIRKFLQQLWSEQKRGEIDLISAALTTDTAIDIVRRLEEDFGREFPEWTSWKKTFNFWTKTECRLRGESSAHCERPNDRFNMRCYDIFEWAMAPTFLVLGDFLRLVTPTDAPIPVHANHPSPDRASMSNREKALEDRMLLFQHLPKLFTISYWNRMQRRVLVEDELTRGFRTMLRTKDVPLSLVFAAQSFVDIRHIFQETVDLGFVELRRVAARVKQAVKEHWDYHPNVTVTFPAWPQWMTDFMQQPQQLDRCILCEGNPSRKLDPVSRLDYPTVVIYDLYQQDPLLCGLEAFRLYSGLQEIGIALANLSGSVLYSAHLYNAVIQEGFCSRTWPQMEEIINFHTPETIFIGGKPTNPDAYFTRFLLCMGWAASSFARNRRSHGLIAAKTGQRHLYEASPVVKMFRSSFGWDRKPIDLASDSIHRLLVPQIADQEAMADVSSVTKDESASATSPTKPLSQRVNHKEEAVRSHFESIHNLTPVSLLSALKRSVAAELPEMTFDYLAFHRTCWSLLRRIQVELHPTFLLYYGDNYVEREDLLSWIVGHILLVGVGTSETNEAAAIMKANWTRRGMKVSSEVLEKAGAIVEDFLGDPKTTVRGFGVGYVYRGTKGG